MGYTLLTLTTPLEGKATGQLASGWRAPPVFTGLCLGPGSPEEGAVEGRGWVHVLSAGDTHTGGPGLPARPKHRAWTRADVWAPLAERGLHLLSSQALRKLQRIFEPCSWSLRSAPAGSPAGPLSCEWPPCHSGGPRPGKSESRLPKTRPPRRGGCRGAQALGRPHPQASPGGVLGRATVPSGAGTRASGPRPRSACRRQAARSWRQ